MICLAILAVAISYGCSQVQDSSVEASNGATEEALIHTTAEVSNSTTAEASNDTTEKASNDTAEALSHESAENKDDLTTGKPFQFTITTDFELKMDIEVLQDMFEPEIADDDTVVIEIVINKMDGQYPVLYDLDCESDGEYEFTGLTDDHSCVYGKKTGTHKISIRGEVPSLHLCKRFNDSLSVSCSTNGHITICDTDILTNQNAILSIDSWGEIAWKSMMGFAEKCRELNAIPAEAPDLHQVESMSFMFNEATSFNQPIGNWNVSSVTNMSFMFFGATSFNQPIGNWDVSNVTDMSWMFSGAGEFNQPLESWDVSSVTNMREMFGGAGEFNQPLEAWDVSKVTDMGWMFYDAESFNQPIGNWDVSSVTNMSEMFSGATSFNQPIGNWNVSSVTNMRKMFRMAISFNQSIDKWNVSKVKIAGDMFDGAESFRMGKPISTAIALEEPNVAGFIDKRIIKKTMHNHEEEIRSCYAQALAVDKTLAGRIVMQWTISPDGSVNEVSVKESTLNHTGMEESMKASILQWRFPMPRDKEPVHVEYPFVFGL